MTENNFAIAATETVQIDKEQNAFCKQFNALVGHLAQKDSRILRSDHAFILEPRDFAKMVTADTKKVAEYMIAAMMKHENNVVAKKIAIGILVAGMDKDLTKRLVFETASIFLKSANKTEQDAKRRATAETIRQTILAARKDIAPRQKARCQNAVAAPGL